MIREVRIFLLCLAAVACCPAQVTTGSISGYVTGAAGEPIVADVRCVDSRRALERSAPSNGAGLFICAGLAPSDYEVRVSAAGHADAKTIVALAVGSQRRVDIRLARADSVQVVAAASTARWEQAGLSAVLDQKQIERLPLNRRDFLQLALLAPGVLPAVEDSELSSRGGFAMHANGAREEFNNFLLDGADNNDANVNRYVLQPSVDAIQEFQIATNGYSAEYGRNAGGQVNVVTRSGSNIFHGTIYEYARNRVFDARNYFDGADNPKFNRHQFGGSLGGPVRRDLTFFFANGDFLRERRGLSRLASVPAAAVRGGDLSSLGQPVLDPFTRQPFPGGVIPASRLSPQGLQVVNLFPLPNRAGSTGNLLPQPVQRDAQSQGLFRLDHIPGAKDRLTLRYGVGQVTLYEPYSEDTQAVPGFGDSVSDLGQNAMAHWERLMSPRAIHSLRLGFNRFSRSTISENQTRDVASLLGVNWLSSGARDSGFPAFSAAGFSRLGDAASLPIVRTTNTYQVSDVLSLVRGQHLVKLGGEIRHLQLNGTLDLLTRGSLSFSGAISGSGLGDLLLGFPSFALRSTADNPQALRTTAYNVFVQDDWKLHPAFTLNFGLRHEYNSPATDPGDGMSTLNFQTGQVARVGTNGVTRSGVQPDRNNFAPRVGFAWQAGRKWTVRGAYGAFFDAGMFVVSSAQYFNPPQFNLRVYFPTATSLITLANPFQGGITPPPSLSVLSPDLRTAYLHSWSFSLERGLGSMGAVTLAYGASKGTALVRSRNINQAPPGPGDVQPRRPDPRYGDVFFAESGANSSFQSFQATWNRSLRNGLSLWAVYTRSKSIDDTSAFLGTKADKNFPQDSRNYAAERGVSSYDMPQRLAVSFSASLPAKFELRGIAVAQSGQPFTPILRFDNSNSGNTGGQFGSDRPDLLRDPRLDSPTAERWFDTEAFRIPARYTFGSAGRNVVRGPGYFTVDTSLARRFALRERLSLLLEAQAFNLLNRTNFALPEMFADEPAFGRIFAAKPARQVQFSARFEF